MYDIGLPQIVHFLREQQRSIQCDSYTFKRCTFKRYPGHKSYDAEMEAAIGT